MYCNARKVAFGAIAMEAFAVVLMLCWGSTVSFGPCHVPRKFPTYRLNNALSREEAALSLDFNSHKSPFRRMGIRLRSKRRNDENQGLSSPTLDVPHLTVILPAYNEVLRIGETVRDYQTFLHQSPRWRDTSSILVVDDGSNDGTSDLVRTLQLSDGMIKVECVSLPENQGKGAAVSFGIRHVANSTARDSLVLIADADGSGHITSLDVMAQVLASAISSSTPVPVANETFWSTPALVAGNRGYQGTSLSRSVLRWGFRTVVRIICGNLRVSDTQCGFKLMTLAAAVPLYTDLYLLRWTHDVEVLFRARAWNMPIADQVVQWEDKEGSKLVTSTFGAVRVSMAMLLEVLHMRYEYARGHWRLPVLTGEFSKDDVESDNSRNDVL